SRIVRLRLSFIWRDSRGSIVRSLFLSGPNVDNAGMVYVIAELRNYRQLARLRADGLPGLEASLAAALGSLASPARQAGGGVWLAALGEEGELDAAAAAAS